jgi:hypothetical protein
MWFRLQEEVTQISFEGNLESIECQGFGVLMDESTLDMSRQAMEGLEIATESCLREETAEKVHRLLWM